MDLFVQLIHPVLIFAEFALQLDSGSTDLWVQTHLPLKINNDTGLFAQLSYGTGVANGTIQFAEVKIGEYTIPNQGKPVH